MQEPAMAPASIATAPPAGHNPLRIQLLGTFRVSCGDQVVADSQWRLSKARSLVKLLALSPSYRLHREQVLEHLWPEMDPEAALNNLHQALFAARRTLAAVVPDIDGRQLIPLLRQVLVLQPPNGVWVDADAFEQQATGALQADDPAASYAAVELYTGDLLPEDRFEDWATEQRETLRDQYLTLLQRLAQQHEERGEHVPAVDVLRRLLAAEPALEAAHVGLMRLYALTGRQQQALRQYARLQEVLAREFDAEPEPATDRLYRAILDHRFPPPQAARPVPPARPAAPEPSVVSQPAPVLVAAEAPSAPAARADFVNRERELAVLRAAIDAAAGGQGRVVLLAGAPGIGKTRTAGEAATYARERGARALWGRNYMRDGAPPYWPWVQVLRAAMTGGEPTVLQSQMGPGAADIARIVPEVGRVLSDLPEPPPLDPEQERFRLFDSITHFLIRLAIAQPLVLVLDDLHWADRSSLLLLEFLADELSGARICVIGSYRDEAVDRYHPLARTLAHLSRAPATQRLMLAGLQHEDVARYSAVVTGSQLPSRLVEAIQEQTEGNPFFMGEVVRLLRDEGRLEQAGEVRSWRLTIPPGVRETVGLRLDRLSAEANQVLTIAAIAGREFALPVLERVADVPVERLLVLLEEALSAGVIDEVEDAPGRFRFSHVLIRQTLYDEVSNARRVTVHRRLGEALERVHAANLEPVLAELAYHFYLAASLGDAQRAIEYATLAGAQAMDRVAWEDAVGHFERAQGLLETHAPDDERRRCELLLSLGEAQKNAGDTVEARETFERAAAVAGHIADARALSRAVIGFADAAMSIEVHDGRTVPMLDAALAALGADDSRERANLLSRRARLERDREHGRVLSTEAVEVARRINDSATTAQALLSKLKAFQGTEGPRQWTADAMEMVTLARQAGDRHLTARGLWEVVSGLLELGDMDAFTVELERFSSIAVELRNPLYSWVVTSFQTVLAVATGRFSEGERLAELARSIGTRPASGPAEAQYVVHLYRIRTEQDRIAELVPSIDMLAQQYADIPFFQSLALMVHLETGDRRATREHVPQSVLAGLDDAPVDALWLATMATYSEISSALRDSDIARPIYEALVPLADRCVSVPGMLYCGPVTRYLGLLAAAMSQTEEASRHFEDAISMSIAMNLLPFTAYAMYDLSRTLIDERSDSERDRALDLARQSNRYARELGMTRLARRTNELIEGIPPGDSLNTER
jgi:DNA-binding SARP family transcriptional activator